MDLRAELDRARTDTEATPGAARLDRILDAAWRWEMEDQPEGATFVGYRGFDDRWSDLSPAAHEQRIANRQLLLGALAEVDRSSLDDEQRLSADLFARDQHEFLAGVPFRFERQPLNLLEGGREDP